MTEETLNGASRRSDRPNASQEDEKTKRLERKLLAQVGRTRRSIRRVDVAAAVCAYATLALALLFFGVLLDHWILARGLSERGRLYFGVFWLAATLLFLVVKLIPVFRRRVNPLYAAKVIEDTTEDRHNLIINWFQLRRANDAKNEDKNAEATREAVLRQVTFQASRQAAKQAENETALDFAPIIRWGIAFAVVVAACCLYAVLSPKNAFVSVERIAAPLAKIDRPQALRVEETLPGDVVVYQGDYIDVQTTIPGANEKSIVELLYSTEDQRVVDASVQMEHEYGAKFKLRFPADESGCQENLTYQVVVARGGRFESRSEVFHIETRPVPSFRPESLELQYPSYTGLEPQRFENQGDVRAVENTLVKLTARANFPVKRAFLIPDGDASRALAATIDANDPTLARVEFPLQWKNPDAEEKTPEFETYRLLAENADSERNRDARDYSVSIIADVPPEIAWRSPVDERFEAPVNDVVKVRFLVEDPDYALDRAELRLSYSELNQGDQNDAKPNPEPIPLIFRAADGSNGVQPPRAPYLGRQIASLDLVPEQLGLQIGDEIEIWGVAFDGKSPEPNAAVSEKRVLVVAKPVANPATPEDSQEDEPQPNENNDGGGASNEGGEGASDAGENQSAPQDQDGETGSEQSQSNGAEGAENAAQSPASSEIGQEESGAQGSSEDGQGDSQSADSQNGEENGLNEGDDNEQNGDASSNENSTSNGSSNQSSGASNNEKDEGSNESESDGDQSNDDGEAKGENEQKTGVASNAPDENAKKSDRNPFETILDYMNREKNEGEENADGKGDESGDEKNTVPGSQTPSGERDDHSRESKSPRDSQDEVEPNFQSDKELGKPQDKRDMPKRTSPDKPSEDSPVYQANNPEKIDPNTRRTKDPDFQEGNDYLAQNADPNAPTESKNNRDDRNIMSDPLDQSPSTAADALDPNAQEMKAGRNDDGVEAPSELDDDPNGERADGTARAPDDLPQKGGDSNDGDGGAGSRNAAEEKGGAGSGSESSGDNSNEPENGKEGTTPSSGSGDGVSRRQGGGGGTGLGETVADQSYLAPADAPQTRYAEEATNLVLEYLEDALKDGVPERLLKELGWTEEELRAFLDEWSRLRASASNDADSEARARYLSALEEIGLSLGDARDGSREIDATRESSEERRQRRDGQRESARLKTPRRLEDRVRAFTKGISRSSDR